MSDKMRGISFKNLLKNAVQEYRATGSLYYVPVCRDLPGSAATTTAGQPLSVPVGPAAGPHTQLAQNILAGYAAGARVFELKTVQILEGEALGIAKPCIYVDDEAYNTEWSTELTVQQAAEEYIKAFVAIKLIAREFGLDDGFQFHMSVGYDLAGIRSPKIDAFLDVMHDASTSAAWKQCLEAAVESLPIFERVDESYIRSLDAHICSMITLSTMHGCPADEIERIAAHLIEQKGLHTYIKCNPTLLGYERVRGLLDQLGYEKVAFDTSHFDHDMKIGDAADMIKRLLALAESKGLTFGVKLTNTFPVKITNGELAGDAMYLSGKPLFPLAIHTALMLSEAVGGNLPISFSGGIDLHNIAAVLKTGIAPVTVATLLLKAGGYKNLTRLLGRMPDSVPDKVDVPALRALCASIADDPYYQRSAARRAVQGRTNPPDACFQCKNCVDVCPNRANFALPELKMAVHLDSCCNECGNCACLCPFGYVPYRDKFTYFETEADFFDSSNDGFWDREKYRYQGQVGTDFSKLPQQLQQLVDGFLPPRRGVQ